MRENDSRRSQESTCSLTFDFSKEIKPLSNKARLAYNILLLKEATAEDLVRATGLDQNVVEKEMKALKKEVGGVKGSIRNGYTLVNDLDARLGLSDWMETQY